MKFICSKQELYEALTNVSKASADKSTILALEGVKLVLADGVLHLTGYDLEIGICTSVNVSSSDNGSAVIVDVRSFSSMIRSMPVDDVEIEIDENYGIHISGGLTKFDLQALSADEYPATPETTEGDEFTISQSILKSLISETIFAVSQNDTKPILKGELFEIEDNILNVVAIDGFRLAVRREKIKCDDSFKFVVPPKTLNEVSRLLKDEDGLECKIRVAKKQVVFDFSGYTVFSRLLVGEFHNYRASIPKTATTEVIVDRSELMQCLDRAAILINDKVKSPVKCLFDGGKVRLSLNSQNQKYEDEKPADISGPKVEIGFNCRYLADPLKVIHDSKVKLLMNGSFLPMKIVPVDKQDIDSYTYLVCTVRTR